MAIEKSDRCKLKVLSVQRSWLPWVDDVVRIVAINRQRFYIRETFPNVRVYHDITILSKKPFTLSCPRKWQVQLDSLVDTAELFRHNFNVILDFNRALPIEVETYRFL